MKCIKRTSATVMAMLLAVCMLVSPVYASNSINMDETGSISITIAPDGDPVSGVRIDLYLVAILNADGSFVLSEGFENCSIPHFYMTQEEWDAFANDAHSSALSNQTEPFSHAVSDVSGFVLFEELPLGIYLIECEEFSVNGRTYISSPAVACIPYMEAGAWGYGLELSLKFTSYETNEKIDIEAIKIWDDNENPNRPKSITVSLFEGADLYETVTLSAENNWRYIWHDLDPSSYWRIVEENVPNGYTVTVEQNIYTFICTNTLTDPTPPPTEPPDIPQTGLPWKPVIFLSLGGVLLVLVGIAVRKRHRS